MALAGVARALVRIGQIERALATANEALLEAQQIDAPDESESRSRALATVARAFAGAGQAERATKVANTIANDKSRGQALAWVTEELVNLGSLERATDTLFEDLCMASRNGREPFLSLLIPMVRLLPRVLDASHLALLSEGIIDAESWWVKDAQRSNPPTAVVDEEAQRSDSFDVMSLFVAD
jgi:hypothetical protein